MIILIWMGWEIKVDSQVKLSNIKKLKANEKF
jgi:hypothetical protein